MNKKVIVFLLVLVGLGSFVWWKTSTPGTAQDRLAQAMRIMQGLESRAIPVALTTDQLKLLEQVYQDSLERIPNIQGFRDADKTKLINSLQSAGLTGSSSNGLNPAADALVILSSDKTDVFASKIDGYMTNLGTTVSGTVATNIKKLAQSVNTLTNDIRLTKLYVSWYESIRGKICTTNDPDNDIYISGEVKMLYSPSTSLQDTCGNNEVKQFKCINGLYEDDAAHVSKTQCPNGCNGGVCLKEGVTMSGEISLSMPETAAVGAPVQISVMTTGSDGLMNYNYTKPFFIIIAGDDDAIFPTGALRMMSGEATKNYEIKFSKAGTMTVTIRPKEGAEVSKTIVVGGGSTGGGGGGYTVGCSSISGVSTNSCNRCVRLNLPNSASVMNVFVPRTGIPEGNREVIVLSQSTITAERYQGSQVSPTGNITNLFNLVESSPTNTSWVWATMKSGNSISKGPIPDSINRNIPIYGIRFQVVSLFKNATNSIVPGTDTTSTECYFYYEQPAVTPVC